MNKCLLPRQVATSGLEKKMLNCYVATMPLPQTSGATYHICTVSGADGNHQDYGVNSTLLGKFAQYFVVVCLLMWNWNLSRQRFYLMLVLNCHHSSLSHSSPHLRVLLAGSQSATLNDAHCNPSSGNQQPVPTVRELSPYQLQLKEKLMTHLTSLHESDRVRLLVLKSIPKWKLKRITGEVNCILQTVSVSSLEHLSELLYCAAKVITEKCGIVLSEATANSRSNKSQPPSEVRLQRKVAYPKKEHSQLLSLKNNQLVSKAKREKLVFKYDLMSQSIEKACEQLSQRIKAYALRLRHYNKRQLKYLKNRYLNNNPSQFYNSLKKWWCCTIKSAN